MDILYIDPGRETPVRTGRHGELAYRYAYARAADTQQSAGVGQDFMAFRPGGEAFQFAVCDGVGQSFFGEIAAQFLARALLKWLSANQANLMSPDVRADLARFLDGERQAASAVVEAHAIPSNLPAMLREVLEEKRAIGSEAMFVCGHISMPSAAHPSGAVFLAWMGDMRARLWRGESERTDWLGNVFETGQRWSTRSGLKRGRLNVFQAPLVGIDRLSVYSDGLALLDGYLTPPPDHELDTLIRRQAESPTSDDIAFLDLRFPSPAPEETVHPEVRLQPVGRQLPDGWDVQWMPIPGAGFYQVAVLTDRERIYQTPFPAFKVEAGRGLLPSHVRVRAVGGLKMGDWAEMQPVQPALKESPGRKPGPAPRPDKKIPWRGVVPLAAAVAAMAILAMGAIGFYIFFGPDEEVPAEPPAQEVVPTVEPADLPEATETLPEPTVIPSPTAMGGKLPSPAPPVVAPEPVDLQSGECYLVVPENGLIVFDQPGMATSKRVTQGTQLTMTGLETIGDYLDRSWTWVEFERHEALGWVIYGTEDLAEVYLEKCP